MIQFYLLSVLLNALAGYALIAEKDASAPRGEGLRYYLADETFRLVLGVLAFATGFFKILSATRGDLAVIGDLFPAVAGLLSGFALLLEFYRSRSTIETANEKIDFVFVKNKKWIGYGAAAAAALHFLFPTVILL